MSSLLFCIHYYQPDRLGSNSAPDRHPYIRFFQKLSSCAPQRSIPQGDLWLDCCLWLAPNVHRFKHLCLNNAGVNVSKWRVRSLQQRRFCESSSNRSELPRAVRKKSVTVSKGGSLPILLSVVGRQDSRRQCRKLLSTTLILDNGASNIRLYFPIIHVRVRPSLFVFRWCFPLAY